MPAVSYDSQSLMVDGRRVWLVSGTIEYSQIPRGRWRAAIRAAKEAGLNCIAAGIPWHLHEKSPRRFTFGGELDLRHFIELIAEEGMYCILRPGPYLGGSFEGGGLPGWLSAIPDLKPREANRPFLDACTRWFGAVMEQVSDLQTTSERNVRGQAGPVILVQIEHEWFCSNDDQAVRYLGELIRYLREEGCTTPLIEANNCWQQVEGAFATWHGTDNLAANMRQFRVVQRTPPVQQFPLLVSAYRLDGQAAPATHEYRLAQAMAVGAMVNIEPACAPAIGDAGAAMIDARGCRTDLFPAIKRLATFANQFGHLFAHLHADQQHAAIAPLGEDHNLIVLYQHGTQGDVVFLLRSEDDQSRDARLLMPDGDTLTVPLGDDRAAWAVFNVNLAGVATLTHTNLRPWAFIDRRLLVLFGPAGADGVVCIDGATIDVSVPEARAQHAPVIHLLDGVTIVVLSSEQVDASCVAGGGLVIGTSGLDDHGDALPHRAFKQALLVRPDGTTQKITVKPAIKAKPIPRLGAWTTANVSALADGSSAAYQGAAMGASLDALAPSSPYGWFRLSFKGAKPGGNLLAPQWGGRLRVFAGGKAVAVLGAGGEATTQPFALKASRDLVLLAGTRGRIDDGWRLGEAQGPAGHVYQVKPVKLGKPKIDLGRAPDPSAWRAFLRDVSFHHQPPADLWTWTVKPAGRLALIVRIAGLPRRALLLANGKPVGGYDPDSSTGETTVVLEVGQQITAGRNTIAIAFFEHDEGERAGEPRRYITMYDAAMSLTAKAEISFAPWAMPGDDAFATKAGGGRGQPLWHRATFEAAAGAGAVSLELRGMSSGRVWLNGHDAGAFDEPVRGAKPPRAALPAAWVVTGANVVTIFDEGGRSPRGCRLISDAK